MAKVVVTLVAALSPVSPALLSSLSLRRRFSELDRTKSGLQLIYLSSVVFCCEVVDS